MSAHAIRLPTDLVRRHIYPEGGTLRQRSSKFKWVPLFLSPKRAPSEPYFALPGEKAAPEGAKWNFGFRKYPVYALKRDQKVEGLGILPRGTSCIFVEGRLNRKHEFVVANRISLILHPNDFTHFQVSFRVFDKGGPEWPHYRGAVVKKESAWHLLK